MPLRRFVPAFLIVSLAACTRASTTSTDSEIKPARIASTGLRYGDCVEARARAAANPSLDVERLPAPVAMKPAPFAGYPKSALRKDGSATVKVDVVIDTLGRADMSTFKVVEVSHPWFERNVRGVIGKWTFTPAQLAGCKVARVYHFMATLQRGARPRK